MVLDLDIFEEVHRKMHDFHNWMRGLEEAPLVPKKKEMWGQLRPARANLYETGDAVIAEFEFPGVKKEDIDLDVSENNVEVKVKTKAEKEVKQKKKYYLYEAKTHTFYRRLVLPAEVIPNKAQAEFKNGILRVEIPKAKPVKNEKKSKIAIK